MGKNELDLAGAKRSYRSAKEIGNRREEARWANVIGDILKNRGQYVEAIKWLRIDYDISSQCLLEKDLLPTCQTLGELYLRLEDFSEALNYQKEHLRRANDANDLVEQQRANTQLGRTYHELFFKNEDHSSLHKAKKHFNTAMTLARILKENPPDSKSSFLKEYIDSHNNIGMLEMDLDNLEAAEKILNKGLKICDEEEVSENDDGRSRLHHNLGFVYTRLRMWNDAKYNIKKDIMICKNIGHLQGEAKGYINLGELCGKIQKFDDALRSYQKALELANSLEDEDALSAQAKDNIRVVEEFIKVMDDIKKDEQNLKKLNRNLIIAKGTSRERKCLRQLMTLLDQLIEKTEVIAAWTKHLEFAKIKKRIASELCDKEKLGDSFVVVGESYQHLRNFAKARKWYNKGWDTFVKIHSLEGQAIVKINIGNILDADGDWTGALKTFEEGYRIAVQANKIPVQINALENMHYVHMMRFDNVEEAKRVKLKIDNLQTKIASEQEHQNVSGNSCSETETEGNDSFSRQRSYDSESYRSNGFLRANKPVSRVEDAEDDDALSLLIRCDKLQPPEHNREGKIKRFSSTTQHSPKGLSKSSDSPLRSAGRKRPRLVLSDDEDDIDVSNRRIDINPLEDVATSNDYAKDRSELSGVASGLQNHIQGNKHDISSNNPVNLEESSCSFRSIPSEDIVCRNPNHSAENKVCIRIKVEDGSVCINAESFAHELDLEALKVQASCLYFLQLSSQRRSNGLLPIIGNLTLRGKTLASTDSVETVVIDAQAGGFIEASINGWVQKRLIKRYAESCMKLSEAPNMKLLMKLYNLEVSEDEVIVSDCELQDKSIVPLLKALCEHKSIAMLDLSHNMLGNATMEELVVALISSGQTYGAFVLDMHCNMFGPTSLFQICECPVIISRLEVLNISGNRLTDACGTYLSTILRNCKALYSLNIERCSLTSRTIQIVADTLDSSSVLSQLSIGYNNPVSGSSLANLFKKLATLERFSELSLCGLKLTKPALDSVCQLAQSSCLSSLMLGGTNIGCEGALQLTKSLFHEPQELVKLDLSYCQLTPDYLGILKTHSPAFCNIIELNLAGNPITPQGGSALVSLLSNPQCSLKVLLLEKCHLGFPGITQIIKSLTENESLEELNLAGNVKQEQHQVTENETPDKKNSQLQALLSDNKLQNSTENMQELLKPQAGQEQHLGEDVSLLSQFEVADSYDNELTVDRDESAVADSANSEGKLNDSQSQSQFIQDLFTAISNAKHLQLLDLSDNGFSTQAADTFYNAWSSGLRAGSARRHVNAQMLHLSIQGKKRFGVKPCCRKD
ncbi:hypothetical protein RND81_11G230100 [Saponaria officinalis]|uniref:Protein TONSOKU n=1 Tax=Saponaria officinalis TaxID=3572 RepID=A0AAW1HRQ3_SAPOF